MHSRTQDHAVVTGEPAAPKGCTAGSGRGPLEKDPHSGNLASGLPALVHSGSRCLRVTVSRPGSRWVRIAVTDKSRTLPVRRAADTDDESGRGLGIVEAVSDRWGTDRLPWGKRVWAECALKTTDCIPGGAGKDLEEILGSSGLPGTER